MKLINCKSIVHKYCVYIVIICLANNSSSQSINSNTNNNIKNEKDVDNPIIDFDLIGTKRKPTESKDCCEETINIYSNIYPEGYLKAPPLYDVMNDSKNKKSIECLYKFFGQPGERIQLFYEDVDLYYPFDIYKLNKIE